jgi:hypothetical protein
MSGVPGPPGSQTSPAAAGFLLQGGVLPQQFLAALQGLLQALNSQTSAFDAVAAAATGGLLAQTQIALLPVAPPAAPASGSILYVSNADGHTYIVNSSGTRTQIAP